MSPPGPAKVLYLNRTAEIGGAEQSLLVLLRGLDRSRFEPRVILPFDGPLCDKVRSLGVHFEIVPMSKLDPRRPLSYWNTVRAIHRRLVDGGIALLHSNTYLCNQYGLPACRWARVPSVSHVRLLLGGRAIRNTLLRHPNRVVAISDAVRGNLSAHGVTGDRVRMIYNGVDVEAFSPTYAPKRHIRQELGCREGDFLVGVLGRISGSKGQDVFIEAMSLLAARGRRINGLVVGGTEIDRSDDYLRRLKQRVRELDLQERVFFMPFVDNVRDIYHALDLVVVPSHAEPFGRVLIEGMAMGKAVVATRAGGPLEIIEDGESGVLVEPGDPEGLSQVIEDLLADPARLQQLAAAGRQRVTTHFSDSRYVGAIERMYDEITQNSRAPLAGA